MSDFLAESQVLIRPDTTRFRAELQAQITAATKGVTATIPITAVGGAALASAAAATGALSAAQKTATATTLGLASAAQVENSALGRQAVLLPAVSSATLQTAAAQKTLAASSATSTAALLGAGTATARLDAALLGLRTAVGSTAVIGLGAAALSAIVLGKALRATIGIAAETEEQFNVFQVTAQATAVEMERAAAAARQLGADASLPGVSSADAAEAMTELARAGLDVEESIAAARGVLQLATAAQLDNAAATELAANALNAFGLQGKEATRVADLLAGAANAAQGGIDTMGIALSQVAAVARQVGLSIEDTVTFLSLLAKNGLQGSDAGTSLRTALIRLINPTDQAREKIEELGIQIRDLSGAVRSDVFAQFAEATESLTPAARDAALAMIFGQDAIRAAAIIAREGTDGFDDLSESVTREGQAAELAAARTRGFKGDVGELGSEAETAAERIGSKLLPVIGATAQFATNIIGPLNDAAAAIERIGQEDEAERTLQRISAELAEAEDKARRFAAFRMGEDLRKDVERLRKELADELGPALTDTTANVEGYEVSLSDAAGRSQDLVKITGELERAMGDAATRAQYASEQIADATDRLAGAVQRARGRVAGLQEQEDILDIGGASPQVRLQNLRAQEEQQRKVIDGLKKNTEARRRAIQELRSIVAERRSLEESIANAAEADVRAADVARDEAYRNLVEGFSSEVTKAQNAVLIAESREGLQDDLQTQRRLSAILRGIIASGRLRARDLATFVRQKIQVDAEIAKLARDIAEARKEAAREARQQRREDIRERLDLSIQIAEATGNRGAEIRAREAEIARIQEEIRQTRRDSLQRKRLILELREAQKSLRELREEREKAGDEARRTRAQAEFEFLQTQQGFAANLFGNLIPVGAASGLVGNLSQTTQAGVSGRGPDPAASFGGGLGSALIAQQQVQGARDQGVTQGQFGVLLDIQRKMLDVLRNVDRGQGAPEVRRQELSGRAMLDILS